MMMIFYLFLQKQKLAYRHTPRPVSIAESQPALKVSFNRPRPRSQPARAGGPGRRARGCPACLFFFTAINF
jgi:hypothetical protein